MRTPREIEVEIKILENKIFELSRNVTSEGLFELGNGDARIEYNTHKVGSNAEIEKAKQELAKLKEELKRAEEFERNKPQREQRDKNIQETLDQEAIEREKEAAALEKQRVAHYKKVKELYKGQGLWARFVNRIKGRKPNWKKISKYSIEKLDFLVAEYHGDTIRQQEKEEYIPTKEGKLEARMNDFNLDLSSGADLERHIEMEATNNEIGRSR